MQSDITVAHCIWSWLTLTPIKSHTFIQFPYSTAGGSSPWSTFPTNASIFVLWGVKKSTIIHRLMDALRIVCWWVLLVRKVARQLSYLCNGFWIWLGHSADVQFGVALLLNLRDHPLESGTTAHSKKDLGGDAIGDALQALLHKGLALQNGPNNFADVFKHIKMQVF